MYVLEDERPAAGSPHPVVFDVEYPERVSRITTFFRLLLVIPQIIVVYALLIAFLGVTFLAWFAILFTGRYPRALFNFNAGVLRWAANVGAYAALLRDEYPPFSWEPGAYPLVLDIPRAERQSRFRLFIRWFAVLPNQVVFWFVQLAWMLTTAIAWFAILFTGRYPRSLFDFGVGTLRWSHRQAAYANFLRDEYPPYSTDANARPGNELVSAIIGIPLIVLYVGFQVLPFVGFAGRESTTVAVQTPLLSPALPVEAPSGEANGLRITVLGYNDDVPVQPDSGPRSGYRYVSFRVAGEKDGRWPTAFVPFFTRVEDCNGTDYWPDDIGEASREGAEAFSMFWRGGSAEVTLYYEIPHDREPCELTYHSGLGRVKFRFPDPAPP